MGIRTYFHWDLQLLKSETQEALIWFLQLLRQYVTPQPNLCMITDRGTNIISTLQFEEVGWEGDNLVFVYCIRHITTNFNKKFKNVELKRQLINMGNNIIYLPSYIITIIYHSTNFIYFFMKTTHCTGKAINYAI